MLMPPPLLVVLCSLLFQRESKARSGSRTEKEEFSLENRRPGRLINVASRPNFALLPRLRSPLSVHHSLFLVTFSPLVGRALPSFADSLFIVTRAEEVLARLLTSSSSSSLSPLSALSLPSFLASVSLRLPPYASGGCLLPSCFRVRSGSVFTSV